MEIAIKDAGLRGFVSRSTLRQLFNLFTWVYMEGDIRKAGIANERMLSFLSRFDLFRFKSHSICESAVLFYQKLSLAIDMRQFDLGDISEMVPGCNKLFSSENFTFKELYDIYTEHKGDLSTDFLLFNELFRKTEVRQAEIIQNYSDIVRVSDVSTLIRPDFPYKLATKNMYISANHEVESVEVKKLYILQDSTYSMNMYLSQLKMLKAFILNAAFENDYQVEWLYISVVEHDRNVYTRDNIEDVNIEFKFIGAKMDPSKILMGDEFAGQQVVIITDGTDMFNFPFKTRTKNLNVISFMENINIKDKISNYGRFFRVEL
jgi:hypothetical protein